MDKGQGVQRRGRGRRRGRGYDVRVGGRGGVCTRLECFAPQQVEGWEGRREGWTVGTDRQAVVLTMLTAAR